MHRRSSYESAPAGPAGEHLRKHKSEGVLNNRRAHRKGLGVSFAGGADKSLGEFEFHITVRCAHHLDALLKTPSSNVVDLGMWCSVGVRGGERLFTEVAHPNSDNVWVWDQPFCVPMFSETDVISIKIFNNRDFGLTHLVHSLTFPALDFLRKSASSHTHPLADRATLTFVARCRPPKLRHHISLGKLRQRLAHGLPVDQVVPSHHAAHHDPSPASHAPPHGKGGSASGWLSRHRAAKAASGGGGAPHAACASPQAFWIQQDPSPAPRVVAHEGDELAEEDDGWALKRAATDSHEDRHHPTPSPRFRRYHSHGAAATGKERAGEVARAIVHALSPKRAHRAHGRE